MTEVCRQSSQRMHLSEYLNGANYGVASIFKLGQGHHHNGNRAARQPQSVVADLQPLGLGYVGVGDELIRLPAYVLLILLAPHCHIWSISNRF